MSDIDTTAVDSLKALDLNRPIREGDISFSLFNRRIGGLLEKQRYVAAKRLGRRQVEQRHAAN